jgi:hypothetical protein
MKMEKFHHVTQDTSTKGNLKMKVEVLRHCFPLEQFPGKGLKGISPIKTNKYVEFNPDLHFYRKQIVAYTPRYITLVQKCSNSIGEFSNILDHPNLFKVKVIGILSDSFLLIQVVGNRTKNKEHALGQHSYKYRKCEKTFDLASNSISSKRDKHISISKFLNISWQVLILDNFTSI